VVLEDLMRSNEPDWQTTSTKRTNHPLGLSLVVLLLAFHRLGQWLWTTGGE